MPLLFIGILGALMAYVIFGSIPEKREAQRKCLERGATLIVHQDAYVCAEKLTPIP